jgi:CHASE3 domain
MFELKFRGKLVAGLSTAGFVLVVVAALTYAALERNIVDRQWVSHTLLVREKLGDLQAQASDAETGQRGFLLTGELRYLDPYDHALTEIRGHERCSSLHFVARLHPHGFRAASNSSPGCQPWSSGVVAAVRPRTKPKRAISARPVKFQSD